MKLIRFRVREFKSIRDSSEIEIGDITCLVGKNEAGKTALLEALYKLNPIDDSASEFNVTHDYPRSDVEDYEQEIEASKRQHATVITATYELEEDDVLGAVKEFGKNIFSRRVLTLEKGYSNSRTFTLHIDEEELIKTLVTTAGLPTKRTTELSRCKELSALEDGCHKMASDMQQKYDATLAAAQTVADESEKTTALANAEKLKEPQALQQLRSRISDLTENGIRKYIWDKYLAKRQPRYLYFDEYFQMTGEANVERLKERVSGGTLEDSDRPMLGLIELARIDLDRLLNPKDTEDLINKLEGASNHLSKQLLKYWSQNKHLQMKFDIRPASEGDPEGMREGTNLWARVYDSVHQATTRLSRRSRGFVWFFSFLAYFSQQKKAEQTLVLLLDEPGLYLHGTAQRDLLTYIEEELKPDHQVIYTTHSPFMVDSESFNRVRIVEDKSLITDKVLPVELQGAKVTSDVLEVSEGSLFPLQHALGYDIAQTLFIGPFSLIVEGSSDLMYIQTVSQYMLVNGRESLDDRWVITPVGGADKVTTFVALIGAQKGLTVATLIDIQKGQKQRVENLYKTKLLKKKHVITFGDFLGVEEADIEDMFDIEFYLMLVNEEFKNVLGAPINESDLPTTSTRLVVRLSEYFNTHPMKDGESFNHYRPARFLMEQISRVGNKLSKDALDRFESVFKQLNALK